ncbi:MAG: CHAT domain-containing protein [Lewinella sp.]
MKYFRLTITLWVAVSFFSLVTAQTRQMPLPMLPASADCSKGMILTGDLLKLGFGSATGIFGGPEDNWSACWEEHYAQHSLSYLALSPAPAEGLTGDELWGMASGADGEMVLRYFAAATKAYLTNRDWVMACWAQIAFANERIQREETAQARSVLDELSIMTERVTIDEGNLLEISAFRQSLYGDIYSLNGDYRQAIKETNVAVDQVLEKPELSGQDSSDVASYFLSLGNYYFNLGDLEQSASCFFKADDFDGRWEVPSPGTNYKLGSIALLQNKPQKAIDYLDECLKSIGDSKSSQRLKIKALIGKSVSWQIRGAYGTALEFSRQATEVPSDEGRHLAWSSLGSCYLRLYQPDLALIMLDSAAITYQSGPGAMQKSKGFLAELYRNTGEAYLLKQQPMVALRFFQRALIENHQQFSDSLNLMSNPDLDGVKSPIYFLRALHGKANALAKVQGDGAYQEASLRTYELAMEWVEKLRSDYTSETSKLGWSETFKGIFEGAIEVCYQLFTQTQEVTYLAKAFLFSEKSKNALLLEQLKAAQGKSYAGISDTILDREKELLVDLAYYTKALRSAEEGRDTTRIGLYRPYLSQTRIDLVAHQEMMERDYPKYKQLKYEVTAPALREIRSKLLDEQTAFLSYFIGKDSTYVLVLTKNDEAFISLGQSTELRLLINDFLTQLKDIDGFVEQMQASQQAFVSSGGKLYNAVLQAPLATLPAQIDRLIIAADGNLSGIPLSALVRTEKGPPSGGFRELPYLLNDYGVQYAYSAALQLEALDNSRKRSAKQECLGLAPDYRNSENQTTNAALDQPIVLARTAREVRNLFNYVSGEYDTTATATKELFLTRAADFSILHLAMHGLADPEAPDLNHLTFADAEGRGDNLLYHHEIANMDLSARLVVLSACETGVGKHEVGEGVFSLARSFSYAGVPSVVMSLWSAEDASTSELMPAFYAQLADGADQSKALQRAKLAFLENAKTEKLHPYFWATFVGIGDPKPIMVGGWSWWWILGLVILGGGLWWWRDRRD